MFLTRSEYDRGVNTFSPEGRLFQVEYAIEAIKLGSTAVGIQVKDGVVIAVEKRLTSTLLVPSSVEKIMEIVRHQKRVCRCLLHMHQTRLALGSLTSLPFLFILHVYCCIIGGLRMITLAVQCLVSLPMHAR
jgi:Proteasome subunit A N-terminal signature/Proteasome subunit